MFNWKIWLGITIVVCLLFLVLFRYKKCKKEGELLGCPYRCNFWDTEPVTMIAEQHYYGKRDRKCYEIIDYGANMSFKEVSMSYCETKKDKEERFEKQEITEVEYI